MNKCIKKQMKTAKVKDMFIHIFMQSNFLHYGPENIVIFHNIMSEAAYNVSECFTNILSDLFLHMYLVRRFL